MSAQPISVVLVEDEPGDRDRALAKLERAPDMDCVATFADAATLLSSDIQEFDILLLDVELGDSRRGVDAVTDIRAAWPAARVVMYSGTTQDETIFKAYTAGASGYIFKGGVTDEQFFEYIRATHRGEAVMSPIIARRIRDYFAGIEERFGSLTKKQREVVGHMIRGMSNAEIGKRMFVGENTVRFHIRNIFDKLHMSSRVQVAYYAGRSERVMLPKLRFETTDISRGVERVKLTLDGGDFDRDTDFQVMVSLPDGLSFDMSTDPSTGSFDSHRQVWSVSVTHDVPTAAIELRLRARSSGDYLIQAVIADCSQPIQPVATACEITF